MTNREIMQQALETREVLTDTYDDNAVYQISLKNRSASSAWIDVDEATYYGARLYSEYKYRCLYAAPPQRQPLTDEEIDVVTIQCFGANADLEFHRHHARAIERAHGIGV
jgi:hypothetical protein